MSVSTVRIHCAAAVLCAAAMGSQLAWTQDSSHASHTGKTERARVATSHALPKLNGDQLKVTLVEVNYGPGESSPPHSHPCPVVGYVVSGAIRTQVKGEAEAVYKAGETFYEPPNGVHAVSANASRTEPAKLLAYFVCDQDKPLSVDMPAGAKQGK